MHNISNIKDCYGCGVCATVCPKRIVDIFFNSKGFYEPRITDDERCTNCGLCVDVCAFSHEDLSLKETCIESYAAWSNNDEVRRKCSSGGIGFEIAKQLIGKGFKVCAVRYNAKSERAEHYVAHTAEELIPSMGSKYIQSHSLDGFKAVNKQDRFLITGTPCQIDSFRRYTKKLKVEDNFVLMDFFCHSVPSIFVWRKYLKTVEQKIGKPVYASWRNKETGWHDSWNMVVEGEVGRYTSRLSQGDIFYRLFLGDFCINVACRKQCKYKYKNSSADIRIGDLWGRTYRHDEKGVSALISFTSKGKEVIGQLKDCNLVEHPFDLVAEGQMTKNARLAYLNGMAEAMVTSTTLHHPIIWKLLFALECGLHLPKRIIKKIIKIVRNG